MTRRRRARAIALALASTAARGDEVKGPEAACSGGSGSTQHLDARLPLDTPLRDESDRDVKVGDYFGKRPVILLFVYYECPMLCTLELNGLVRNLKALTMTAGKEFDVVTICDRPDRDPRAGPGQEGGLPEAVRPPRRRGRLALPDRHRADVRRPADTVGFKCVYDPGGGTPHPAGLVVDQPHGTDGPVRLPDRLPREQPPMGDDRGVGGEGRLARRPAAADVLPLRPLDGPIQLRGDERRPRRGRRDGRGPRRVHASSPTVCERPAHRPRHGGAERPDDFDLV